MGKSRARMPAFHRQSIYGVGAIVERVERENPIFGKPLFKKDF